MFARVCTAVKKNGEPCKGAAWPGSATCLFHSQDRGARAALRKGRHLGGAAARARAARVLPNAADVYLDSAEQVRSLLAETCSQLRRGELDRHAATGIGYLCTVVLSALELEGTAAPAQVSFVVHAPTEPSNPLEQGTVRGEPTDAPTEPLPASNDHFSE